MKIRLLWLLLAVSACTTAKTIVPVDDSKQVLTTHAQPFKVFGIGRWKKDFVILTLTDANNQYLVVQAREDSSLKIGSIYNPE